MRKLSNVFYGWIVVGISTLVFAIVRGVNDAFSVFFVAILEEFGWSRAAVAGVFSLARLTEGTVSVGIGMLSDLTELGVQMLERILLLVDDRKEIL